MKDFEWQTDEEDLWEEEREPQAQPAGPKRRWWPGALVVVLVVVVAGGLIYRQLNRRVEEAVSSVEEDVIAAFHLVRTSADRRDRELLVGQVSGRDPRWTSIQKELLEAGVLFDRIPFGLWLQADEPRVVSVELAPNLSEAELVAEQVYAIQAENGVTETVRLQQTMIFRLGERRWLYAPPEQEFWGDYVLVEGEFLTLEVPERDREIGVQLAAGLDRAIEHLCTTMVEINCPAEPELFVRLETDPESWLEISDPANRLTANSNVILPAPSLLGLPVDEAAYEALWRGYAEHVLSPFIAEQVGYDCCQDHFLFYEALLRHELSQLGIRHWPMGPAEYEALARGPIELGALSNLWFNSLDEATPEGRIYALAAIDFVLQSSDEAEPAVMQRSLDTRQSYWSWLQQWFNGSDLVVTGTQSPELLGRRWLQFVNDQTLSAQQPPPVPLPEQEIQMLCGTDIVLSLHRYDLTAESWERELDGRFFMSLIPLPDDAQVVLEEHFTTVGNGGKQVLLWNGEQEMVAYQGSMDVGLLSGFHGDHPAGDVLRGFNFLDSSGLPTFFYLDLGQCDASGCAEQSMTGLPIWSPDGQHMVIWEFLDTEEQTLVLGDGDGRPIQRLVEGGFMPFWIDNYTIGYIDLGFLEEVEDGMSEEQLVRVVSLDNLEAPQTALSLEDLRVAIPEEERNVGLSLSYVRVAPDDPHTFYVAVNSLDDVRPKVYIFEYKWPGLNTAPPSSSYMETGTATLLISADDSFATFPSFQFSPDGRWLTTVTSGWRHPARLFFLHDRTTGQTQRIESSPSFPHYDWSADSNWLLRVEEGYMSLSAPAYDYHRLLFYDQPQCAYPAWVNK
jgi:hypothetical protein